MQATSPGVIGFSNSIYFLLVFTNDKLANATLQSGKVSIFKSAEITGDTSAQSTAHGLARTPAIVFAFITNSGTGAAGGLVEGAHTGTNVIITAPTGVKYRVIAF